jgi:phosphatidylinositol phospholipase C beta
LQVKNFRAKTNPFCYFWISSPRVQAKMAEYFVDVFHETLLTEPLDTHPCEENHPLPSPNDLKYKILIKNKKLQPKSTLNIETTCHRSSTISASSSSGQSEGGNTNVTTTTQLSPLTLTITNEPEILIKRLSSEKPHLPEDPHHDFILEDEDFSDDDDKPNPVEIQTTPVPESKATRAMSDLVNYIVPIRFKTFARAEERNRSFEMSSFSEDKAYNLIRDHAKEFLAYNQRQLSRIYPRGTRFESSNYNPYIFWPIGCQMAALNYQTLG